MKRRLDAAAIDEVADEAAEALLIALRQSVEQDLGREVCHPGSVACGAKQGRVRAGFGMNKGMSEMVALDEGQQVLHWRGGAWHRIAWQDWMSFRELDATFAPLPYVVAGEHRFVVCVVENGRLYNIIPHRYLIDRDGRIADDRYFGVLSDAEIGRYQALNKRHHEFPEAHPLTDQERREFDAIRDRLWRSWSPPVEAVRDLTRAAVALPDENDAAWNVLEACGISRGVSGRLS